MIELTLPSQWEELKEYKEYHAYLDYVWIYYVVPRLFINAVINAKKQIKEDSSK